MNVFHQTSPGYYSECPLLSLFLSESRIISKSGISLEISLFPPDAREGQRSEVYGNLGHRKMTPVSKLTKY